MSTEPSLRASARGVAVGSPNFTPRATKNVGTLRGAQSAGPTPPGPGPSPALPCPAQPSSPSLRSQDRRPQPHLRQVWSSGAVGDKRRVSRRNSWFHPHRHVRVQAHVIRRARILILQLTFQLLIFYEKLLLFIKARVLATWPSLPTKFSKYFVTLRTHVF